MATAISNKVSKNLSSKDGRKKRWKEHFKKYLIVRWKLKAKYRLQMISILAPYGKKISRLNRN